MAGKSPSRKKIIVGSLYALVAAATIGYYWYSQVWKRPNDSPDLQNPVTRRDVIGKSSDPGMLPEEVRRFAEEMPDTNGKNDFGNHLGRTERGNEIQATDKAGANTRETRFEQPRAGMTEAGGASETSIPARLEADEDKPDYSDAQPPTVFAIRFEPQKVHHGDPVSVFVRVTDNLSGVSSISGVVRSPSGTAALPFRGQKTGDAGSFFGTLNIPDRAEIGMWHFSMLRASDKAHNERTYSEESSLLRSSYLEVVGIDADSVPPVVTAVYLHPSEAHDGDRIKVTVEAQDDKSDITMIYGVLLSPSKHAKVAFSCRKEDRGRVFSSHLTLPADAESGDWTVDYLQVKDASQNTQTLFRRDYPDLFDGASIRVYATRSDSEPPSLDNVGIYPAAVVYGETVEVIVYGSDDVSGVSNVSGRLQSPSKKAHITFSCVYDPNDGGYKAEVVIPINAETGTWQVDYILMIDRAQNQIKYTPHTNAAVKDAYFEIIGK